MSGAPDTDLVLVGPMGAGKTSTGRALAVWLDRPFLDLDEAIVAAEGQSIPDLFARGESKFRAAESRAIERWLSQSDDQPRVLAVGGGAMQAERNATALCNAATVVHLDARAETLVERLVPAEVGARPLLAESGDPQQRLEQLRTDRASGYAQAHVGLATDGKDVRGAALAVLRTLYDSGEGLWAQSAHALDDSEVHPVAMGRGIAGANPGKQIVMLWDRQLNADHAHPLKSQIEASASSKFVPLELVGGEEAKSVTMLMDAWRSLLAAGVDRDALLVAVGGGTVTDLGGLLAHSYKRGIELQLIPTTLVAQLDAALGGKNGINLDRNKNAIGTVRFPQLVQLDPLFLLTLDDVAWRGGLCEAIKTAMLGDASLLDRIEAESSALGVRALPIVEEAVARTSEIKLSVVARDAEDHGPRFALNLGHTLGHALEGVTAKTGEPMSHGDAVSIGIVFAMRLANRLDVLKDTSLIERVEGILTSFGLPIRAESMPPGSLDALIDRFSNDKKRRGDKNIWVLPVRPGEVEMNAVDEDIVHELLSEFI